MGKLYTQTDRQTTRKHKGWKELHDNQLDWLFTFYKNMYIRPCAFTSVCIVQEDKSAPVIVIQQWQQSASDWRPKLQRELALSFGGEAGCH